MLLLIIKRMANAIFVILAVSLLAFTIFKFLVDPFKLLLYPLVTQLERGGGNGH